MITGKTIIRSHLKDFPRDLFVDERKQSLIPARLVYGKWKGYVPRQSRPPGTVCIGACSMYKTGQVDEKLNLSYIFFLHTTEHLEVH